MKKQIGNTLALYPTPLVIVGAMIEGKPNWLLVGHLGIIGHDRVMVSLAKSHYTNQGIKASRAMSINIVDEALLPKADTPTRAALSIPRFYSPATPPPPFLTGRFCGTRWRKSRKRKTPNLRGRLKLPCPAN